MHWEYSHSTESRSTYKYLQVHRRGLDTRIAVREGLHVLEDVRSSKDCIFVQPLEHLTGDISMFRISIRNVIVPLLVRGLFINPPTPIWKH